MRLGVLFLFVVAAITRTLAVDIYNDLVLTSIDVKDIGNGRVEFSGITEGKKDDTTAVFLKNVKRVRWEGRRPIFHADKVTLSEAKKTVRAAHTKTRRFRPNKEDGKPLLCVHGFNVQPENHLKKCLAAKDKFTKFKLIPVIWPTRGGVLNYVFDRGASTGAGKAFKSLASVSEKFPKKALMAHSMGNRVLRFGADARFKFDNIFMVAADVNGDMFNQDYIEGKSNDEEDERRKDGLTLKDMLNSKGTICVLHNNQDFALTGSTVSNLGISRLGSTTLNRDKLHTAVKDKIETKNAGRSWLNWSMRFASHGYQWDDEAVEYYESKFYDDKGMAE